MILKYSDLKGRTDLVGRTAKFEETQQGVITTVAEHGIVCGGWFLPFVTDGPIELLDEEPEHKLHFVEYHDIDNESDKRPKVSQNTMFKDSLEGQTHSYNDGCGDPAHNGPAGTYEGAPMKGDPVDTRTEITWDNLKAGDTLVRDFFRRKVLVVFGEIFAWAESGTDEDVDWAFKGEARRSGWKLDGSNDKPIKMTISQIEEKLGHKVEIVE